MPIYAYKCESCGHQQDVLQRLSDDPLTICPACGASTYAKQVTAAGFQLKGSGWYQTDFRNNGGPPAAKDAAADKDATAPKDAASAKEAPAPTASTAAATPAAAPSPAAPSAAPASPPASA